jgi:hypothetical protein
MNWNYEETPGNMDRQWYNLCSAMNRCRKELCAAAVSVENFSVSYGVDLESRMPDAWQEEHSIHINDINLAAAWNEDDRSLAINMNRPDGCDPALLRKLSVGDVLLVKRICQIHERINNTIDEADSVIGSLYDHWDADRTGESKSSSGEFDSEEAV